MKDEVVRLEQDRGVARLVMAAGANALDIGLMEALRTALSALRSEGAPPFVLASAHPGVFCPGWDLKRLANATRPVVRDFLAAFNQLILDLFSYPGATVAAVGGHAVAGGCLLAMACDVRVMAAGRARIGQSEVNLGVPVPAESLSMLSARLAPRVVADLVFRCDGYTAERALELGLIHEVAPAGRIESVVEQELRRLCAKPREAYRETKHFLLERVWAEMGRHLEGAANSFLDCWFQAETQGRIHALAGRLRG